MNQVQIFDTTLRDGEQSPGASMTQGEKVAIARQLERVGVDVIEAGFPVASPGEAASVAAIAQAVRYAEVAALCRTREGDIQRAWEAVRHAAYPRLHVFIATSAIHLEHKLCMTEREVLRHIAQGVRSCAMTGATVEFSAEDATRTDTAFLCEAAVVAAQAGASVINVPDTVGYATPWDYHDQIAAVVRAVEPYGAIVSAHCHDDLGMAVANSLAAVRAGARQVEVCVNGIGERAGNASLEEVVMALVTRADRFGVQMDVNPRHLCELSAMVSRATGMVVPPNKAVVGRNAFAHESGIHQHGVLSAKETYEIMSPEHVGWKATNLVLGKHSGRHALRHRMESLGYDPTDEELREIFGAFKALCDRRKAVYDDDLHRLGALYCAPLKVAAGGRS